MRGLSWILTFVHCYVICLFSLWPFLRVLFHRFHSFIMVYIGVVSLCLPSFGLTYILGFVLLLLLASICCLFFLIKFEENPFFKYFFFFTSFLFFWDSDNMYFWLLVLSHVSLSLCSLIFCTFSLALVLRSSVFSFVVSDLY